MALLILHAAIKLFLGKRDDDGWNVWLLLHVQCKFVVEMEGGGLNSNMLQLQLFRGHHEKSRSSFFEVNLSRFSHTL